MVAYVWLPVWNKEIIDGLEREKNLVILVPPYMSWVIQVMYFDWFLLMINWRRVTKMMSPFIKFCLFITLFINIYTFHVAIGLYNQCHTWLHLACYFFNLTTFSLLCDLLLNIHMVTWNLFVNYTIIKI